jgi:uncharacterized metal-binding protein YceD (DUF177 family)
LGKHTFGFEIGKAFFGHLDYAAFEDGDVKVHLLIDKRESLNELRFDLQGYVVVACARCLDPMKQSVSGSYKLIIKYGEHFVEESDEVMILPHEQHHFDFSHLIYEYISLLVPFKCVHGQDEDDASQCNPLMIEKLIQHKTEQETDPRWEALRKLQNKKE